MRSKQGICQRTTQLRKDSIERRIGKDFAKQGIAVGMRPAGGQADQHVAGLQVFARQDVLTFEHADDRSGDVELVSLIDAGHLGMSGACPGPVS